MCVKGVALRCECTFRLSYSTWLLATAFPAGSTHRRARVALATVTARVCPLEVGCVSRCPLVVSTVPTRDRLGARCA